jgi:hypothetical protein
MEGPEAACPLPAPFPMGWSWRERLVREMSSLGNKLYHIDEDRLELQ